ncbi:30S ribosomal protein S3 [Candidatus Aminicenantes bacterium AC-335-B20]|nr:30S ribosomal protein S3 [SCandidatus Aminicenantes bacterium Aminicenantia_JdfR_composite]MCP2599129.1 30S ribosomal protein S3 [Candidatus Aminicenantes bacterium AC-335-B20]MCP2605355.1 30S ribosomal protein S3 [Candidatus Aminicenantes bacterium AC-335-O07]MCP2617878.1 30S ribosomal protein S3 [Candidatus Aminicenantes bacterium AC-335-A11]MCP2619335.1 30S ribosomal protein S3 [Candidatus Aminicenantes bacterium AC-335-K20]MCP2621082.1 30S ribosomal protein S3 [Candidatus Aminicenantes 
MGQKTHPYGFRIGFNKGWRSRWFAKGKEYAELVHQDLAIKREIKNRYFHAGISSIEIERVADKMRVIINTARSGIIIGRGGREIENLRNEIQKMTNKEVYIDIQEILKPELDAQLVAEGIALQLEKRVSYRRAMRKAVDSALRMGAKGIKVMCSGRLGGVEIARSEWYLYGRLPLQTLKADIDYGFAEAFTKYGLIGVKVWIYKGDVDKVKFSPSKQIMEEI